MAANIERVEETIDQLADEIAELLIDYVNAKNEPQKSPKIAAEAKIATEGKIAEAGGLDKRNLIEIAKLKNRVSSLEHRVEKYIKNLELSAIESGRLTSEKSEEIKDENEQMLLNLQGQVEELRTAMIRLSNQVKRISGEQ